MERKEITPGLTLPRLVYGMWRVADDSDRSPTHVRAKIEACIDQGITTVDQADIYGDYEAEAVLGDAARRFGKNLRLSRNAAFSSRATSFPTGV